MVNEEASIDTLFHVTPTNTAIKILEQDSFLMALSETNTSESFVSWLDKNGVRVKIKRNIPKLFYLSFARTPSSGYIADRASGLRSVKEPVMFVVNGRQLKNINRNSIFVPQDYWHNSDENGRQLGASREAEERFYSANPRTKLGSALIEIRIIADTHGNDRVHSSLRKLILLCKKKNIVLKLFSKDNKAGFIRGVESNEDRAKALAYILSKTNKDKPWSQYKREPGRDLLFLKDLLEKNSYYEISEKDRGSLYYYLSGSEIYGDLAKHFSSTIHNIRGGRDDEKEFLYALLKKHNVTSISKMFIMLQAKWTRLRDEYNAEEDRKWLLSRETKEAAAFFTEDELREQGKKVIEEEALVKPQFPKITGDSSEWGFKLSMWMGDKGFKKIGMGAYAHVFTHPNLNYVLKVYIDKAYEEWVKICQTTLRGNPNIPVFRGKPFKVGPFTIIRMEKLTPFKGLAFEQDNYRLIDQVVRYSKNKPLDTILNNKNLFDDEERAFITEPTRLAVVKAIINFLKKHPEFKSDLHQANFMIRGDQLVIIDPISVAVHSEKDLVVTEDSYKSNTKEAASTETEEEALSKANLPALTNKKWRADLTKWAKSKGFKAIGKGTYGKVFYSVAKPDIVIKVFSDLSYRFWYKVAVANKGNSAVPKFIGAPVKIANGLWAVRMEKLEPLTSTQKVATWMIETFTKFHAKENYGIPTASNFKKVTHAYVDDIRKTVITDDMETVIMNLLFALSKGENSLKYMLDLHEGNFMRRGDTIVMVDPLQLVNENLRSLFRIDKPSTTEDAMASNYSHIDVLSFVPPEKIEQKVEVAETSEVAESVNNRKTFMTMPGVKQVLIGPKDGPLIPVMYSAEARMFFPVFKE